MSMKQCSRLRHKPRSKTVETVRFRVRLSNVLLLLTRAKHVVFMIKARPLTVDIFWSESNDQKHCMQELLCGQNQYASNVDDPTQNHFFPHPSASCRKMCKRFFYVSFTVVGFMWKEIIQHWESDESSTIHTVLTLTHTNPVVTCFIACHHVIDLNLAQKMHIKSSAPRSVRRV